MPSDRWGQHSDDEYPRLTYDDSDVRCDNRADDHFAEVRAKKSSAAT